MLSESTRQSARTSRAERWGAVEDTAIDGEAPTAKPRGMSDNLPDIFCWTRFGTEAGETIEAILERKDRERRDTDGMFLWGIGNSVAPAMLELLQRVKRPEVLFSAIKSPPRRVDVAPAKLVEYRTGITMDGRRLDLPSTIHVHGGSGTEKMNPRYALVCRSANRLALGDHGRLVFEELSNLLSGNSIGASQVTAVVRRREALGIGRPYLVAMRAELCEPFFVRLSDPVDLSARAFAPTQPSWRASLRKRAPAATSLPAGT